MNFDNMLYGMTTIIEAMFGTMKSKGSGFFYNPLGEKDPTKAEQWREIKGTWLITNRHVALPKVNDKETIPNTFTFNLRQINNGLVQWVPIMLTQEQFTQRLKLHTNSAIDVVAIDVGDLIVARVKNGENIMNYAGLTSDHLPKESKLPINVGDDILVAGYPRCFYDETNKFPIVKAGIISSKWGCNFNGNPVFLIDAKLFPGSSGSVVISKPRDIAVIDGRIMYSKEKPFIFLGIYSGQPFLINDPIEFDDFTFIKKDFFNVGNVWYSSLVPDIIENGQKIT